MGCPGCGCHYAVPTQQWCNINGVQTACPSSGLCQDAAGTPTPPPTSGLLQKTSVESVEAAKANSTVACDCNPTCPGCGCHYAVPTQQWCNINGVQTACPSSGLCQDAASTPTPPPTSVCLSFGRHFGDHWCDQSAANCLGACSAGGGSNQKTWGPAPG